MGYSKLIAATGYCLVLFMSSSMSQAASMIKADDVKKNCVAQQTAAPENKSVSLEVITRYCTCFAKHAVEIVTDQQSDEAARLGRPGVEMSKQLKALGHACASCITNPCEGE